MHRMMEFQPQMYSSWWCIFLDVLHNHSADEKGKKVEVRLGFIHFSLITVPRVFFTLMLCSSEDMLCQCVLLFLHVPLAMMKSLIHHPQERRWFFSLFLELFIFFVGLLFSAWSKSQKFQ